MTNGSLLPVDVIFLTDVDGNISPLRIRAEMEDARTVVGHVTEVLQYGESGVFGAETHTFLCRVRSEGRVSILKLKYFVRTHRWYLSRAEERKRN